MNKHEPDRPPAEPAQTPIDPPDDRLDSWKEIAVYVRRGVRTVQRWERDSGLPIHRLNRERRSVVFAFRSEIDAWWAAQGDDGADEESPTVAASSGDSRFAEAKPGAHRWFIASPPLFWFLAVLAALGAWVLETARRTPRLPDSSAREATLPGNLSNPKSQS